MGFYTVYKKQKEYRYMKKTIKRKQKLGIRIGVGCALVITVILLAVQGVSNLTKKPVDTSEGIAYIKGKESADAKTIEQKINQLEKKDGTGDSSDTRSMKERFSGAVVMGDSIAASFTEYDVLNTSSVVAKIGIHFSELDDQIEQAKQLDPQIVFLAYGMNDVTKTNGDVDKFIKDYSDVIKKIQKAMPDAHIFVNAVFPVQESAVEKEPALANIADYNEKLEGGITFLHIPVSTTTYANTLFPIILASFFASKVEKLAKKVLPEMIQLMMVPTVVLALTVPLSYLVIGPVMQYVSNGLSTVVCGIFNFSPILGGLLFGAFWQLVVLLGLHAAFIPVLMNNLFTLGSDPINAILGLTVWALAGVALGYSLRTKDPDKRSAGFGSLASALCGVTEPAIYSIAVPNMKLFACAWVGGGISGAILGGLGAKLYALAGDGLFRIPGMINPAGLDVSFYGFIACAVLAFGVSAVLAYIVQGKEEKKN